VIFTAHQAHQIAVGRQTQTRVPAFTGKPCPVKVSHDYPVQVRRGSKLVSEGRIKILGRGQQRAGDITYTEARAEGCRTTVDWKTQWVRRRDTVWLAREKVDLIAVYDDEVSIVNWILLKRFDERHADALVWALAFEPVVEVPRFLADQRIKATDDGQYTTSPARAIDPAECVDQATQERYAKLKHEDGERRRASFRADLEAERQRRRNLRVTR
jgi:hypothetical protein